MVHFVGAGPGATDLITLRGAELLKQADIVIYAGSLVNPALLGLCREDVRLYDSAKMTLEEVMAVILSAEKLQSDLPMTDAQAENEKPDRAGVSIVRLHSGDPSLYGATREQIEILKSHHIPYDITPGVSSFNAASAALEAEYTPAGVSQTVIITRMEGRTAVPEKEKLRLLASHGATMVIFLSTALAEEVQRELLQGGAYREDTPAAVVYRVSWPEERILHCFLGELAETVRKNGIQSTALLIVGDFLSGRYEESRLYAADFSTAFRQGTKPPEKDSFSAHTYILCFTQAGRETAERIRESLQNTKNGAGPGQRSENDPIKAVYFGRRSDAAPKEGPQETLSSFLRKHFSEAEALIFVGAAGIAVRAIAPFVRDKTTDPAVVVLDEQGRHVISLLSGHLGGANTLCQRIAERLGGEAVITTATDLNERFAVDLWAKEQGLMIMNPERIKTVSAAVLSGETIRIRSLYPIRFSGDRADNGSKRPAGGKPSYLYYYDPERDHLSETVSQLPGSRENNGTDSFSGSQGRERPVTININVIKQNGAPEETLFLCPGTAYLGIGCKKGISKEQCEAAYERFSAETGLIPAAVAGSASIDLKREESGLLSFAAEHGWPLSFYSAEELNRLTGDFSASAFVKEVTGVDSVCERSAVLAAGGSSADMLLLRKWTGEGVTFALAVAERDLVF